MHSPLFIYFMHIKLNYLSNFMSNMRKLLTVKTLIVNIVLLLLLLGYLPSKGLAQPGINDTILAYGVVLDGDTIPEFYLNAVDIRAFIGKGDRKREIDRLRANIYKVYPYAIAAQNILNKVDSDLGENARRRDRKAYLNALDKELNMRFKDELKDLSVTQGQILVKLINRQTGKDVYSLLKELKGGFNARMYQTAFKFFDNNLKTQYDPYGADKDIEMIVQDLEQRYTT
jgi:hypothetical protein